MPVTIFKPVFAYPCPAAAGAARTVPAARLLPRTGMGREVSPVFPFWLRVTSVCSGSPDSAPEQNAPSF